MPRRGSLLAEGENPFPVRLVRPPAEPLSTMARLGERMFFDASLSASGRMSCASCHDPAHHYGPPNAAPVMLGGPELDLPGVRPVPTLTYLEGHPPFSVGPDKDEDENSSVPQQVALAVGVKHAPKTAANTAGVGAEPGASGGAVLGRTGGHAAGPGDRAAAQSGRDGQSERCRGGGEAAAPAICADVRGTVRGGDPG